MLVLHGFWAARDGFGVWAEDSELAVASTSHAAATTRTARGASCAAR